MRLPIHTHILNVLKASQGTQITLKGIERKLDIRDKEGRRIGVGTATISALVRRLRKPKYGGHNIVRTMRMVDGTQIHTYELKGQNEICNR